MQQHPVIVVTLIVLFFAVAVALAAYFGSTSRHNIGIDSSTTFFAKSGKMRRNVQVLTSKKKTVPKVKGKKQDGRGNGANDYDKISSAASMSHEPAANLTEEERTFREALNTLEPRKGIEKVKQGLATAEAASEAHELYTALGVLYARLDPPEIDESKEAFDRAKALADSNATLQKTARREAAMLVSLGHAQQALACVNRSLSYDHEGDTTVAWLELNVIKGKLEENIGNMDRAEDAYLTVIERVFDVPDAAEPGIEGVYRQACLRLTRLYNNTGREKEAKSIKRKMKHTLTLLRKP